MRKFGLLAFALAAVAWPSAVSAQEGGIGGGPPQPIEGISSISGRIDIYNDAYGVAYQELEVLVSFTGPPNTGYDVLVYLAPNMNQTDQPGQYVLVGTCYEAETVNGTTWTDNTGHGSWQARWSTRNEDATMPTCDPLKGYWVMVEFYRGGFMRMSQACYIGRPHDNR